MAFSEECFLLVSLNLESVAYSFSSGCPEEAKSIGKARNALAQTETGNARREKPKQQGRLRDSALRLEFLSRIRNPMQSWLSPPNVDRHERTHERLLIRRDNWQPETSKARLCISVGQYRTREDGRNGATNIKRPGLKISTSAGLANHSRDGLAKKAQ